MVHPSTTRRTREWDRGRTGSENFCTKDESINPYPLPPESTKAQVCALLKFDFNEQGKTSELSLIGIDFKRAIPEINNGSLGLINFKFLGP